MGIQVSRVRYGRPAATALQDAIANVKGNQPLAPVTVVVPSNHVGVATRRLLACGVLGPVCDRGVGIAAVTFVTPYRLAELLGAPSLAGSGRRPVSTPVIAAALRMALADDAGVFGPVAAHPATETALVTTYRELRDISPGAQEALGHTSRRAADVVRLHQAARAALEPDWYDEQDLITAAIGVLSGGGQAHESLGAVIVYLPQRLSRHSAELLKAGGARAEVMVLAGTTGDARADADVALSVRRLGGDDPPPATDPMAVVSPERTRILTASDSDEEVRAAVRAVIDAARQGTPLDRIALLHASPEPYARLAHEQLSSAGIEANGASVMPLTARAAARTLLQLLDLPRSGFQRGDVFAWLAGARIHHLGHSTPVTSWERLSRDAGVVAGRDDWDQLLGTFADDCEASANRAEADPDADPWRAERDRQSATRARQLRAFVVSLIDDLDRAASRPKRWSDHAAWARHQLTTLLGTTHHSWPLPEQKAADRVDRALHRLACLDGVEVSVSLDVFTRTLQLELEADLGRIGRMGEGVLVGGVGMGVGLDLDLVVVLGLAEGSFPAPTSDDSLLPDHERQATGDELPLRSQRVDREHRELLAALAGARRHLLCVPRGDLRQSSERVPSRWVLQIVSALDKRRWWSDDVIVDRPGIDWMTHVASFDAGLRRVDFPANEQEHRLRSLMAGDPVADVTLDRGREVVASRRSNRFTRFDGNLAGLPIPSPVNRVTSATTLEGWAACPFAYLLHHVLRVDEIANPEARLEISRMDWGSLVHKVLERFIDEVLARPRVEQPSPDEEWSPGDRARLAEIGAALCDDYQAHGLTGRAIFWRRDRKRILTDLQRVLTADSEHRAAHGTRPVAAELSFGFPDSALGTVALSLPDGRAVQFRGKADRVDITADGTLHVVDYKTGSTRAYKDLSADNPDQRGRKLQLAVYGQAARMSQGTPDSAVRSEYWFVSAKGGFERIGYAVTPAVLDQVGRSLDKMVRGIENGVFPNYPTASSTTPWVECAFCDPDALGVTDLRSRWDRKLADPAMAPFLDLAAEVAGD
jgi:ATP-dependent helicase/nuclease subunit B